MYNPRNPSYPRSRVRNMLRELTRKAAVLFSKIGPIDEYIERLIENRKIARPTKTFGSVTGIDGSINSAEIYGNFKLYAVSAAAYGDLNDLVVAIAAYHETPHTHTSMRVLMSALEAFMAYESLRRGTNFVLVDGGLIGTYNHLLGIVSGIANTLENEVIAALDIAYVPLSDIAKVVELEDGESRLLVVRGTPLYKAIQDGIEAAYKELRNAFDFRRPAVDAEALTRTLVSSDPYRKFKEALIAALEPYADPIALEEALIQRKHYIEPLVNAYAAFGVYVDALTKSFDKLKDAFLLGISKRIDRVSLEFEELISKDPELRSRIGRALMNYDEFGAPGYLRILKSRTYKFAELKLTGRIAGIRKLGKLLQGDDRVNLVEFLYKPRRRAILRVEAYHEGSFDLGDLADVLAGIGAPGNAKSSSPTLFHIDKAHEICTIDNAFMEDLARIFKRHLSTRIFLSICPKSSMYVVPRPAPTVKRVYISTRPEDALNVGELVILEYRGRKFDEPDHLYRVLGIVVSSRYYEGTDYSPSPEELRHYSPEEAYYVSPVYLLGELQRGHLVPIVLAPPIGTLTRVKRATLEDLARVARTENPHEYIVIGEIPGVGLEIPVNLSAIATKHLAILAITGAGKSNTVAHIVRSVLSDPKRILPIFIFDFHGEYSLPGLTPIEAKIDLGVLSEEQLLAMFNVPEQAYVEAALLTDAFRATKSLQEALFDAFSTRLDYHGFFSALIGTLVGMVANAITSYQKRFEAKLKRFEEYVPAVFAQILPYIPEKYKASAFHAYILALAAASESIGIVEDAVSPVSDLEYILGASPARREKGRPEINPKEIAEKFGIERDPVGFLGYDGRLGAALSKLRKRYQAPITLVPDPSEEFRRLTNLIRKALSFYRDYGDLIGEHESAGSLIERAFSGVSRAYVIDLSRYDLKRADIIVSIYMREAFEYAKRHTLERGPRVNALLVLEEAHNFIGYDSKGFTKPIAERVMREGRKYGVGMIVVSQRPRRLDTNVMSQVNNYVILKIVHPEDQQYVRDLTESLPDELARSLSDLEPGHAVLVGPFVEFPVIVKIPKVEEKKVGATPRVYVEEKEEIELRRRTRRHVFPLTQLASRSRYRSPRPRRGGPRSSRINR